MKKLGDRNFTLISRGAKTQGTLDPDKILFMFEEELYVKEHEEVIAFLKWCHANGKTIGWGNYEDVFAEFKKRDSVRGKTMPQLEKDERKAHLQKVMKETVDHFEKKHGDFLFYLKDRWDDEKQYEDWAGYEKAMKDRFHKSTDKYELKSIFKVGVVLLAGGVMYHPIEIRISATKAGLSCKATWKKGGR